MHYTGRLGELFRIFLVNLALNVLTLTGYRFWARTRVRGYLWSQTRVLDEPLEYGGGGLELFVGFLIVLFVIILPLSLGYGVLDLALASGAPEFQPLLQFFYNPLILFLIGVALYRARRYRLSRTMWRGVRFGQTGSSAVYGISFMFFVILSFITLGWFVPEKNIRLWSTEINNSHVGSERFRFDGWGHRLYKPFAIAWLLAIPTFGMSFAWYKAAEFKFLAARTRFQNLRFRFEVSGGRLLGFVLVNWLLRIVTLGLATPFIQQRRARFIARNLSIMGIPDLARIARRTGDVPGVGEGLAEAFDLGAV